MAEHRTFRYRSLEDLEADAARLGLGLRFARDLEPLRRPARVGPLTASNRLAVQPMEGCDGEPDGSPGPLTLRRYQRFGAGGAGLLWFEACAVDREGRANPRQLWLHEGNVGAFAAMLAGARAAAKDAFGEAHRPVCVLQLTHSGRYARPDGQRPRLAARHPFLDPFTVPGAEVVSDAWLDDLAGRYVRAAALAREAGFDAVDVKACHGYLMNELLGARTREGRYGGGFENRSRLLLDIVRRIRAAVPDMVVATRLNVYDAIPWPFGFGMAADGSMAPDLDEPIRLVRQLAALGVPLVNVTAGNPYYNPHIGRPFDQPVEAAYLPDEHPLEGVARLVRLAGEVQRAVPDVAVVGTGYSWLRQYLGHAAAAAIEDGLAAFAGAGREAFAHPEFARELLCEGRMRADRVCITCSSCTQLMRDGSVAGCVPRDKDVYSPVFVDGRRRNPGARRAPHPVAPHFLEGSR